MNFGPRHFRTQLLASFLLLVVVPLVVGFSIVYSRSTAIVRDQVERAAASSLNQAVAFVDYQMQHLHRITEFVALNRSLRDILLVPPGTVDLATQLDDYTYLSEYLVSLQSRDGAYRIRLYLDDRWFYSREQYNLDGLSRFDDIALSSESLLGRQTITLPKRTVRYNFEDIQDVVTVIRPIYATADLEQVIAVVAVDTLSANIEGALTDMLEPYGGTAEITDDSGEVLLAVSSPEAPPPETAEEDLFRVSAPLPRLAWNLETVALESRVLAPLLAFQRFVFGMAVAVAVAIAALGLLLSLLLSRRVVSVVESIRAVRSGELATRAHVAAEDEIGLIEQEFNSMVEEIATLVAQVEQDGVLLREAELTALQSQVNPHFLYNTLDLISWKALEHNASDIHELVGAMAKFYKTSLARGRSIVTLANECEHIRLYARIENMRFDDSIAVSFDVPESLRGCELPRITLQPLVENSIHHGILETDSGTGHVWVRAFDLDGVLHVDIVDDGETFLIDDRWHTPESLGVLSDGFGVRNIHDRLRVLYGSSAGLRFRRRDGGGTVARISVPLRRIEETP